MSFMKAVTIFAGLPALLYVGQGLLQRVQISWKKRRLAHDLEIFNTALDVFEEMDTASDEQLIMLDDYLTNVATEWESLNLDPDNEDDDEVLESLEDSYDRFVEFHCRICESRLNIPKARNKRPINR